MIRFLHSLSAFCFYLLGSAMFGSFVLLRNGLYAPWPERLLTTADLPLLAAGMLYGGTSVYLSLRDEGSSSRALALTVALPLLALFLLVLALNFWPVLASTR